MSETKEEKLDRLMAETDEWAVKLRTQVEVKQEAKPAVYVACMGAVLTVCLTLPIWYILLFGILWRTEAPAWQWVLFIIYVPVTLLASLLNQLALATARAKKKER